MNQQICMVCASDRTTIVRPRAGLAYVWCRACDHCTLIHEHADAATAFEAAQQHYYSHGSVLLTADVNLFEAENVRIRHEVLGKHLTPRCRVLEVGPGAGHVVHWLQQQGHQVAAIEESPTLANQLAARFPDTIRTGAFEALDVAPGDYDAFCSFHVIEHVKDPLAHLQHAFHAVRAGGMAFIATPNATSWQQMFFRSLSPNVDSAHLFVVSHRSLRTLAVRAGWQVVSCHTPDVTSGWVRVLTKALRRLKKQDEEATAGHYAARASSRRMKIAMHILQKASWPLRGLQAGLGYGNEVLLVLVKPGTDMNKG